MMTILSAVFGFAAPFLPELFKFFNQREDRKHELALMQIQLQAAAQQHTYKMEEINATADIAEMQTLRTPQQSFGVQVLDAASKWAETTWGKCLVTPIFYLFSILDFTAGMVRPAITLAMVAFYISFKWTLFKHAGGDIVMVWGEYDWAVLNLVLAFWFGARTAKAAFGGSASTGKQGGG